MHTLINKDLPLKPHFSSLNTHHYSSDSVFSVWPHRYCKPTFVSDTMFVRRRELPRFVVLPVLTYLGAKGDQLVQVVSGHGQQPSLSVCRVDEYCDTTAAGSLTPADFLNNSTSYDIPGSVYVLYRYSVMLLPISKHKQMYKGQELYRQHCSSLKKIKRYKQIKTCISLRY